MAIESLIIAGAFVAFGALIYKPVKSSVTQMLDSKIEDVTALLRDAQQMKFEAEQLHKEAMMKLIEAEELSVKIINNANEKAEALLSSVESEVAHALELKRNVASQKLSQQEKVILDQLKQDIVKKAVVQLEQKMTKDVSNEAHMELVVGALNNTKKVIH